jgi:hypothetical protein
MAAISTDVGQRAVVDGVSDVAETAAPPLAPTQHPIDLAQLSRMTLGEEHLEREVLTLFDLQAGILLARMNSEGPRALVGLAHTLTGSARGVGAWKVAEAAEAIERLASAFDPLRLGSAMNRLTVAVTEAQVAIAAILSAR